MKKKAFHIHVLSLYSLFAFVYVCVREFFANSHVFIYMWEISSSFISFYHSQKEKILQIMTKSLKRNNDILHLIIVTHTCIKIFLRCNSFFIGDFLSEIIDAKVSSLYLLAH